MRHYRFDEVTSTNEVAKAEIQSGNLNEDESSFVVSAKRQTNGRGRLNHVWDSSDDDIYMTFCKQVNKADSRINIITSVMIRRVLNEYSNGVVEFDIKWPNDIYCNGKKISGILSEECKNHSGNKWILVGIGINVNRDSFDETLTNGATSLYIETKIKRDVLHIIEVLAKYLDDIKQILNDDQRYLTILSEYKKYLINLNKYIKVETRNTIKYGIATDVMHSGELVLDNEENKILISSGDAHIIK